MISHLFLHASLFLVCSKNDVAMKVVENFLHFTTMVSTMYHRPTLSRIATCSSHFAFMRTRISPCFSLPISSFMFEPPLMHLSQNKYVSFSSLMDIHHCCCWLQSTRNKLLTISTNENNNNLDHCNFVDIIWFHGFLIFIKISLQLSKFEWLFCNGSMLILWFLILSCNFHPTSFLELL